MLKQQSHSYEPESLKEDYVIGKSIDGLEPVIIVEYDIDDSVFLKPRKNNMLLRTYMAPRRDSFSDAEPLDAVQRETFLFSQNMVLSLEIKDKSPK
jgi:hypothetical protein